MREIVIRGSVFAKTKNKSSSQVRSHFYLFFIIIQNNGRKENNEQPLFEQHNKHNVFALLSIVIQLSLAKILYKS